MTYYDDSVPEEVRYPEEVIERVDRLYDLMPLPEIEEYLDGDVPEGTMKQWARKGWISTDKCWRAKRNGVSYKVSPMAVVNKVRSSDMTQSEVAEKFDVAPSTVSRYMSLYRKHQI